MNDTQAAVLLLLTPGLPLLLGAVLMMANGVVARLALHAVPWTLLPAVIVLASPDVPAVHVPWLLLGTDLELDAVGEMFLLLTVLLWGLSGLYAKGYIAIDGQQRFFIWYLLAMSGNLGLVLAQDLLSFYLFFAVMSFASYGLIVHDRSREAWRAGRVYIALVILSEMLLFGALVLAVRAAESESLAFGPVRSAIAEAPLRDLIILLTVTGFGIKAGMPGLHVWLPLAHPVAPTPASAVLSGVMIKAGLLGWLRLLPLGEAALPTWGAALMATGVVAAFYGVVVGLPQRDPKTVLAYSSISQMGLMTLGVGFGLVRPDAWPAVLAAVLFYALHHGFAKAALFLGVGVLARSFDSSRLRRLAYAGLLLPALALAGAPATSGAFAKDLLKAPLELLPRSYSLDLVLALAALGTSLLMIRVLYLVRLLPSASQRHAPTKLVVAWLSVVAAGLLGSWILLPAPVELPGYAGLLDASWPIAGAAVLAAPFWHGGLRKRLPALPEFPPGDILVPVERGLSHMLRALRTFSLTEAPRGRRVLSRAWYRALALSGWERVIDRTERRLARWPTAMALFVFLLLMSVLLALG